MIPGLDPNHLVIFYLVAKEKSLSAAADKLHLTQPAITYHLKSLQEYSRVKLLEFKQRQVTLTPHGQELYKYAEEIYRHLVDADALLKAVKESNLRAGTASMFNFAVGPVIKKMFEEHPEVKLTVHSGDAVRMVRDVLDSNLDLAIVPRVDYDGEKLKRVTVSPPQKIVCFASYNQIMPGEPLSWAELASCPLVSGPEDSIIRQMIEDKLKSHGLENRQFVAEVSSTEWCKTLVENGKGISFTTAGDIEEQIKKKKLRIVRTEEDLYVTAEAVMRSDAFMNPNIKEFISQIKQAFGYTDGDTPDKS
jgi:DNA-binding transcriptional LysR family regulator